MKSGLYYFILKAVTSGILVAVISSVAKAYPKWAALITALPLVTFISLIWIHWENKDLKLLEVYTWDVFLWTLPGILFFISATLMFRAKIPFFWTLLGSSGIMALGLLLFHRLGILRSQ